MCTHVRSSVYLFQGITYDTGGADVKAGGHMAGMHRDKCGAAFVAGFFKVHVVTQILLSTTTRVGPCLCQCPVSFIRINPLAFELLLLP